MATVNQFLLPGFTITIEQFANPSLTFTVVDRAGNVIDLTGYKLKLAAIKTIRRPNGLGVFTLQDVTMFDVDGTIVTAKLGNVSFANLFNGAPGTFRCSLRIWDTTATVRLPTDAYTGTYVVTKSSVKEIT